MLQERLAKSEKEIDDAKYHQRHYLDKKKEHDTKVANLHKDREACEKKIAEEIINAEKCCPRIKTRRTALNVENEIHQIEKRIKVEQKSKGSRDEITRTYHEKYEAFKKIRREVKQLDNFINVSVLFFL